MVFEGSSANDVSLFYDFAIEPLQYAPNQTGRWAWPSRKSAACAWSPEKFSSSNRSCWSWKRRWRSAAISTASIPISCDCSSTAASRHKQITFFSATTWIEVRHQHRQLRLRILTTFLSILGKQSLETICLLLAYKIKYPENFFLLRGNHECASINRIYGNFVKRQSIRKFI